MLLQNLFCAYYLPGYFGTSSIFAVSKIDKAFAAQGIPIDDRKAVIGESYLEAQLYAVSLALHDSL